MKIILSDPHQQFNNTIIEILSHVLFNLGDISGMEAICESQCVHARIELNRIITSIVLLYNEMVKIRSKEIIKRSKLHLGRLHFYL